MNTLKTLFLILLFGCTTIVQSQNKAFEVTVTGTGDPILLFPGFTCTATVWDDTVAELSKEFECHVFTFAGFGEVPPIEKPWLPKIKAGIEAYIIQNNLNAPIVIGHSLGGTLGLWLAAENTDYKKIIVVDALPATGALMIPNYKSEDITYNTPYNKQLLAMDDAAFLTMANQMAIGMSLKEEKRQQIADWILNADRETYVYGYTDLLKLDLRADLVKIKTPVIILAAMHPYGEMVKKTYHEQYKYLEKYDIKFAENAAHFIMYDQPEWFLSQVKAQLK